MIAEFLVYFDRQRCGLRKIRIFFASAVEVAFPSVEVTYSASAERREFDHVVPDRSSKR